LEDVPEKKTSDRFNVKKFSSFYETIYMVPQLYSCKNIWMCEGLTELEDKVREAVGKIVDPETGMTFAEMQLVADVKENETGVVKVDFIPSSPFCPIAFKLAMDVKNAALKVAGVKKVLVYCRGHMMEQQINEMVNKEQK
jgi:metal-sulfur cluster biosynthetic enzyme